MAIEYHGVEADDLPSFNLSPFFYSAAEFINNALQDETSKDAAMGKNARFATNDLSRHEYDAKYWIARE